MKGSQLTFSSKKLAYQYYEQAKRRKQTCSLPFINHNNQWQITVIY